METEQQRGLPAIQAERPQTDTGALMVQAADLRQQNIEQFKRWL